MRPLEEEANFAHYANSDHNFSIRHFHLFWRPGNAATPEREGPNPSD